MKKNLLLTVLCSLLFTLTLKSQWTELTSFNQVISDIQVFNNQLFIGGNFTKRGLNDCYWYATYGGTTFVDQSTPIGGSGLDRMTVFDNTLYATGSLSSNFVLRWTGTAWTSAGSFNSSHTGIFTDGVELYVGSDFGVVSKRDALSGFTALPSFGTSNGIYAINKYNGDIIVAGNIGIVNSIDYNNIAKWDGIGWQPLGTGLSGEVKCLAVYNSELYVGGSFTTAGGQSAAYIAKWNGTSWSNVGGSVTGSGGNGIRDMYVHNNMLFVVGSFSAIGGVPTNNVAMWDGNSWNSLDLVTPSSFANCVTVFNNKLYVGTFDFDDARLYSRDLSTIAIENIKGEQFELDIYPNPNNGAFTIELGESVLGTTIEVFNALGSMVLTQTNNSDNIINLDIKNQPCGVYFVKVSAGNKIGMKKIIIE